MSVAPQHAKVDELIRRLDQAMKDVDDGIRCRNVKQVLMDVVQSGEEFLDAHYLLPTPDCYARRLIHHDPQNRYSVLAMVWDRGQGTPLHDHAGTWCVECVYRGRIRVTSYSVHGGDPERDLVQFEREKVVMAGVGEAGALIPPFEYHVLENATETPAVTIHVYGGDMSYCHIFEPVDGGYLRKFKELRYTA
ncbi:MAG TPA: cysteine dioxygenase family protein [Candidatus Udaeobacter sp.]|jgi:predicted metal-dependent enzyme (double-stranded beta helix superfamily)|nr:cysteine dioxygenase family protein [Candidatus Udaeobacter sp.]